jgi:hypothetical protein
VQSAKAYNLDYRVFRLRDSEPVETLETHVLVRAYVMVWRALYLCEPFGEHSIESLGLAIDFGPCSSSKN